MHYPKVSIWYVCDIHTGSTSISESERGTHCIVSQMYCRILSIDHVMINPAVQQDIG